MSRQLKIDLAGYSFILPNITGVLLFTLFPMIFSLIVSFMDWDYTQGIGNWDSAGFQNSIDMRKGEWFINSLLSTIVFAATVVPLAVFLALVLAVMIDKYYFTRLPIRLAFFMPYISSVVAVAIVWVMICSPWGPFTQVVKLFGVESPPQWLRDPKWAPAAIILMTIWSGVGCANMIYTSAIQGLPKDVYEATDTDGVNEVMGFFRLTVPSLPPATFFLIITTFVTSFRVFVSIQIVMKGSPGTPISVLVYYIHTPAFTFYKVGYASAISQIPLIILFIIAMVQWKGQKKRVSY